MIALLSTDNMNTRIGGHTFLILKVKQNYSTHDAAFLLKIHLRIGFFKHLYTQQYTEISY